MWKLTIIAYVYYSIILFLSMSEKECLISLESPEDPAPDLTVLSRS